MGGWDGLSNQGLVPLVGGRGPGLSSAASLTPSKPFSKLLPQDPGWDKQVMNVNSECLLFAF